MPNEFFSPGGDVEKYFMTETWLIDQYIGDKLFSWGNGADGKLGINNTLNRSTPVTTFPGGTEWKFVSVGRNHTAALKSNGTLWLWGQGSGGKLGTLDAINRSTPVQEGWGASNWKQVSAGNDHTAAIKTDGTLWTWGNNNTFQLGKISSLVTSISFPIYISGTNWSDTPTTNPEDLYTLSAGLLFSSAIKTDGTLWTWGDSVGGVLGTNDTIDRSTPVTTFAGGTNWKQVSSSSTTAAGIKTDGSLWTWGTDASSKLGRPVTSLYEYIPVTTFAGGNNWADTLTTEPEDLYTLSAGSNFSTALKTNGTLWIWGGGAIGRLGTNDTINRSTPTTTFAGGTDWKQVSAGLDHVAAIKTDGTLWTWGSGNAGRLGNNSTTNRSTPVTTFVGGTNWKQVSAGDTHTAAIKTDNTLWIWGDGAGGVLGNNAITDRSTPITTFAGGTNWKQVSAGNNFTAAVKTDNTLWVWGLNSSLQLGINNTTDRQTPVTTFAGGTDWKQVSGGNGHTAAVKTDGTLWIWGTAANGKLGINSNLTNRSTPVTTFAGGTNWKQVYCAINSGSVAAVKTDGTLWTWGANDRGQLGTADTITRLTPVTTFAGGTNWKQISVGNDHMLALWDDGVDKELYVFGDNSLGELGIHEYVNTPSIPVQVFPKTAFDWKQVSCGENHLAAVKTNNTLWVWGSGVSGTLGTNDTINRSTPTTTFAGGTNWKHVSAGNTITTSIKTDSTLWIWGSGDSGRLGTNDTINRSTPVTTFAGGINWKQVSAGNGFASAIKTDGTLWMWGNGSLGALGINDTINRSTPVTTFAGGINWDQVSTGAGGGHCTALKTDGTLWVWGSNLLGRLGTNDTINRSTPVQEYFASNKWKQVNGGTSHTIALHDDGVNKQIYVFGNHQGAYLGFYNPINYSFPIETFVNGDNWKQVSSGGSSTFATKNDGTLWTWGDNSGGQLGTNDTIDRLTPTTTFAGGTNWKQVSASFTSAYVTAIKTDGTLWVWGNGIDGRLGTNDTINRSTPVTTFAGGTNWKQVNAGDDHTIAIKTNGTLWVWGNGGTGRLGNNSTINRSTPVTTFPGGTDWRQISAGYFTTSAIKTDGTLWTWGNGAAGRLGTNDTINRSTPVTTFPGGNDWKQVSTGYSHTAAVKSGISMRDLM